MNPFKRAVTRPEEQPTGPSPSGGSASPAGAESAGPVDPDQTAQHIDQLTAELEALRLQVERLTQERSEAEAAHKHALADFQNYQRRALANEQSAREQGVRAVLTSIVPILDHFQLALGQTSGTADAASIVQGVAMIRDELLRALGAHGVRLVNPEPGEPFDPSRHEAVMHQTSDAVPPGHVVACFRPGFVINDRLVRPAQVSVAPDQTEEDSGDTASPGTS
jgi:molecular chaperone GrpE